MLRIIVTGLIAQYPLGGVTWDYLQYVLGLARLGHDIYYIEDTGQWPFNPHEAGTAKDCKFNVSYLNGVMSGYGLGHKWAYRFPWESQWFGLTDEKRNEIIQSADLLLNISGTLAYPEEYRHIPRMAYIDSDPVFTQVKLSKGQTDFLKMIDMHDIQFSFGECFSDAVPNTGHIWHPTRQPVVLSEWHTEKPVRDAYTTIMNWTSYKPVKYQGKIYAQKDVEFERYMDLPVLLPETYFEIAVNTGKTRRTPRDLLTKKGWHLVHPDDVCPDMDSYRSYIESSRAEWSVAKNGYVIGQSGWFSCRSACYLAAGKPVIVQDTGFSKVLPVGDGILTFTTLDEAVSAIHEVEKNYQQHSQSALVIAKEYFCSDKVLSNLLDKCNV